VRGVNSLSAANSAVDAQACTRDQHVRQLSKAIDSIDETDVAISEKCEKKVNSSTASEAEKWVWLSIVYS